VSFISKAADESFRALAGDCGHAAGPAHSVQTSGFPSFSSIALRDGNNWKLNFEYKGVV
jgi:hypothetical protein